MFVSSWEGCLPALPCPHRILPWTLMPDQNYCQFLELPFWFRGVCLMLMWRYWHPDSLNSIPGPTQGRGRGRGRGIWCVVVFIVRAMLLFLCFHFWRVNHNDNEGWGWGVAAYSRVLTIVCMSAWQPISSKLHAKHTTTTTTIGEGTSTSIERIISLNFALSLNYFSCCSTELQHGHIPPRKCPSTHTLTRWRTHTLALPDNCDYL